MARALSEEKRQGILKAAADMISLQGLAASTAAISQAAGVATGTLFNYFPSKDDLLNHLYLETFGNLADQMLDGFPEEGTAREQFEHVWRRLVVWGVANPELYQVKYLLRRSDRIRDDVRRKTESEFEEIRLKLVNCLRDRSAPEHVPFFTTLVHERLADATVEAIAANPEQREALIKTGFEVFWRGVSEVIE